MGADIRRAFRTLRKTPSHTIVAVLTLAFGVGLNSAVYSVLHSVVLRQLPYSDPERLVSIEAGSPISGDLIPAWLVGEWIRTSRAFESFAVYGDAQLTLTEGDAEVLRGTRVSAGFFESLGVEMALGRTFTVDEDRAARAPVMILTHGLWLTRFAADPAVVGRSLNIAGQRYTVIGVLPVDFQPLRMRNPAEVPQFFAPAGFDAAHAAECRRCQSYTVIARLKRGVTATDAAMDLSAVTRRAARDVPGELPRDLQVSVRPLLDRLVGPVRAALWLLFGAVTLVLLVACANVASMQLAQTARRIRELCVRSALGASRARLVRQLIVENLLLAVAGGAAGVLVAIAATQTIVTRAPKELPRLGEIHVDARVLMFTLLVAVATGLLFGIAPAWLASKFDANDLLKRSVGFSGRTSGDHLRRALVITDVVLAFVLAMTTGLLVRTFDNLKRVPAGFNPHHVLTMTPALGSQGGYGTADGRLRYFDDVMSHVRRVRGVVAAAMVSNVPLSHVEPFVVRRANEAQLRAAELPRADVFWASPDYFRVLEIPLLRGRLLTDRDGGDAPAAAIVSESFAIRRYPGADAIGQRIQVGPRGEREPWVEIVGIVGDVRDVALDAVPDQAVYLPQALNPFHYTRLVIRTVGDPASAVAAVRQVLRDVDPTQAVFHVQSMDNYVAASLSDRTFTLALIGLFALLTTLLSALGIYGVVSYSVAQRTSEFGVRAVLGATPGMLLSQVLREAAGIAGTGLAIGLATASLVARLFSHLLFGVHRLDPAVIVGTAGLLTGALLLAAWFPARAAARLDPSVALRAE